MIPCMILTYRLARATRGYENKSTLNDFLDLSAYARLGKRSSDLIQMRSV